jgi:flavin reductase (DIM6/NTAB) family NADH-FMN oxidoreductase RutF
MSEKVDINVEQAFRLVHPMHTVLVSCIGSGGEPNIITLAWVMPTSINPPLIAISVAPKRHSHALIEETEEFVVNVPTMDILRETTLCGMISGKSHSKFKEIGLTPIPSKKVKAPAIEECIAHIECKMYNKFTTGDHTIFVGKIVHAYANEGAFNEEYDLKKARMIFHLGGNNFSTLDVRSVSPKV